MYKVYKMHKNINIPVQIILIFKPFLSLFELFQIFETPQVKNSSRLTIRCEGDLENTDVIGFGIESWINCAWSRGRYQFRAQISNQNDIFIDFNSSQTPHSKNVLGLIPSFMWRLDLFCASVGFFIFALSSHSFRSKIRFDWMWPPDQGITASLPVTVGKISSSPSDPGWLADWLDDWIDRWVV